MFLYTSTSEPAEILLLTIILYENEKETDYAACNAGLHECQRATVYRLPFLNHNFYYRLVGSPMTSVGFFFTCLRWGKTGNSWQKSTRLGYCGYGDEPKFMQNELFIFMGAENQWIRIC